MVRSKDAPVSAVPQVAVRSGQLSAFLQAQPLDADRFLELAHSLLTEF